ncbi:MAG: TSUP family transporter, partial [Acidimicrobiia bacterium]
LIAILGLGFHDDLQRINAAKNVLAGLVNLVAAVVFLFSAEIAWAPAVLIAVGSVVGGQIGALVGRRLPPVALRGFIVVVGVAAMVKLLTD